MGIVGNFKSIGLINEKLNRLESLLMSIRNAFHSCASRGEIQADISHGRFVLTEIADVVSNSGRSVYLAPYWFFGNKMKLPEICSRAAVLLDEFENLNAL